MELWMWILGVSAVAGGFMGGWFLGRYHGREAKEFEKLKVQTEQINQDFSQYREEVGEHFRKTAHLVSAMTASYGAVYQHLTSGAQKLCPNESLTLEVERPIEKLIAENEGSADVKQDPVPDVAVLPDVKKEDQSDESKEPEAVTASGNEQMGRIYH